MRFRPWVRVQTLKTLTQSPGLSRTVSPRFRTSNWRRFHYNFNSDKVHHKMAYYHRVYPFYLDQQKISKFRHTQTSVKFLKIFIKFILFTEPATRGLTKILCAISENFMGNVRIFLKLYGKVLTNFWQFAQISENLVGKFMGDYGKLFIEESANKLRPRRRLARFPQQRYKRALGVSFNRKSIRKSSTFIP